jgi:hypothetical protein
MSTQWTGGSRRFRLSAVLIALALTVAVFVLATQANSIRSTRIGPPVRPVSTHPAASASPDPRTSSSLIYVGCRGPKYGCPQSRSTVSERP